MSHQLNEFSDYYGQNSMETDNSEENGMANAETSVGAMDIDIRASANGDDKDTLPDGKSNDSAHLDASAEEDGDV